MEEESLSNCTEYQKAIHPNTFNNPIGWHHAIEKFHRPHSSIDEHHFGSTGYIFFWNLEGETDRLSRNVGKKLPLLAA